MELLTVSEVAARLKLHEMTVRRHIKQGRLRAVRVGRSIRVPEDELNGLADYGGPPQNYPTRKDLRTHALKPPTRDEIRRRQRLVAEMERLRQRSGSFEGGSAALVRVSRRADEVLHGDSTWEDLIAEES